MLLMQNEDFEMIVVLPNENDGLKKLERKFDWKLVANILVDKVEVDLSLPKFGVESTQSLQETIENVRTHTKRILSF